MTPWRFCVCIAWLTATIQLVHCKKHELTFELPDNEKFCFFQEFTGSRRHIFEYKVVAGGMNDVDVALKSPNGKILYKETKRKADVVTFDSSRGTFEFCFSNEFSTFTHKVVYFSLQEEAQKTLAEEGGDERPRVNTQAEESMEAVHTAAVRIVAEQTEYRLNEARGRHMAELLNRRVQWWSILEGLIIFVTGIGQVFVLRAFFTVQRTRTAVTAGTTTTTEKAVL